MGNEKKKSITRSNIAGIFEAELRWGLKPISEKWAWGNGSRSHVCPHGRKVFVSPKHYLDTVLMQCLAIYSYILLEVSFVFFIILFNDSRILFTTPASYHGT